MALFILAVVVFVLADVLLRLVLKRMKEKKLRAARESALDMSIRLDFSREQKSLRRADVENPKARILCVDDEEVVLDSFRKILVLDGYSVDTVETGQEALGLIQSHHYDFVFTDLKMPEMNGEEVVKAVKHMRPDMDVIIITGYATVESAVECMQYGAMNYVQKPFTETELLDLVQKSLIMRKDRIEKQLKPKVLITHVSELAGARASEFAIPGGAFISEGHCWASMAHDGTVTIGIDDFAKKLIGRVDDVELPNLGMTVKRGQPLFSVRQSQRRIPFRSPVSGKVIRVNARLKEHTESLDITPYERNWVCALDADELDAEIPSLRIGRAAVSFYQDELNAFRESVRGSVSGGNGSNAGETSNDLFIGILEHLDDREWSKIIKKFFDRQM